MDPTRDELLAFIARLPYASELDEFDIEEAIYWFALCYHSGQYSNLYSVLSTSEYHPGPLATHCEPGTYAEWLFADLEAEYA